MSDVFKSHISSGETTKTIIKEPVFFGAALQDFICNFFGVEAVVSKPLSAPEST